VTRRPRVVLIARILCFLDVRVLGFFSGCMASIADELAYDIVRLWRSIRFTRFDGDDVVLWLFAIFFVGAVGTTIKQFVLDPLFLL
jgi:hypothetical protein